MAQFRRRNFIINPGFQWRFIAYTFALVSVAIATFYVMNLYFFSEMMKRGIENQLVPSHVYFVLIREQKELMDRIFLATGGGVFLTLLFFGILLSHRIAGPLYRLKTYLESAGQKDELGELSFRDKDYFPEIPVAVNRFLRQKNLLRADSKVER